MQRVLDVGNCDHDHGLIRSLLDAHFAVHVVRCHTPDEAWRELQAGACALVLVNRQLDHDGSEGVELIRQIKARPQLAAVPCMLISNLPEAQTAALAAGALSGFGKRALTEAATRDKLSAVLG